MKKRFCSIFLVFTMILAMIVPAGTQSVYADSAEESVEEMPAESAYEQPEEAAYEQPAEEEILLDTEADRAIITKVDLTTAFNIPDMITVGDPVDFYDYNSVVATNVESDDGPLDLDFVKFDQGESGWYFYDDFLFEEYDWSPYQEDTLAGMNFFEGENRLYIDLYVPEDANAEFASHCKFTINGKPLQLVRFFNDYGDVVLRLSVYSDPTITGIWLTSESQDNWAGKVVENPEVKIEKITGNTDIPIDAIEEATAYWSWQDGSSFTDYYPGEVFKNTLNALKVQVITKSGYNLANSNDYGDDYLKIYLNGDQMSDFTFAGDYMSIKKITYYIGDPEIYAFCKSLGADAKGFVSKDNVNWDSYLDEFYPVGSSVTFYAKPDEGSEFVAWRNMDAETVCTDPAFTFTVNGRENYYAVFQKAVPATGTLCSSVDYIFDSATGTLTLIPTEDDGEGGKIGHAVVPSYESSPFCGNTGIKHIVIQEGIDTISNYVFQRMGNIQSVSLPASMESVGISTFDGSTLLGEGFTVADGNEYYSTIDGSLFRGDGTVLFRFFQKTGQTEYVIPDGVEYIEWGCFENVDLDRLTLRGDGLELYNYVIQSSTIRDIVIEEGVRDLGEYNDFDCLDTQMTFPASLQYVGEQTSFLTSESILDFYVPSGSEYFAVIDGVLYRKKDGGLRLVKYPNGRTDTEFTIPDGVKAIDAFQAINNKNLKTVTLPESVSYIGDWGAFSFLNGVTVVVNNPECEFYNGCFQYCENITLKSYVGSTAQEYAADHGMAFEPIGEDHGKLAAPKNLRWDGNVAKWDAVPNAKRYDVKYYRKEPGYSGWYHMDSQDVQITDGSTQIDFSEVLWYKQDEYMFTVKASATGYQPSDVAESPTRAGRFSVRDIPYTLDGDTLTVNGFTDDEGVAPDCYTFMLYDMDDNYLDRIWFTTGETKINLRSALKNYGYTFGKYKIRLIADASWEQVGGWAIEVGESAEPIIYDYEDIPKVGRIELTIPHPVEGGDRVLSEETLDIKAYCGDKKYDAVYTVDHRYQYRQESSIYWNNFSSVIEKDKYEYGYYMYVRTYLGYEFADDMKIIVNGKETDATEAEIISYSNMIVQFQYRFPMGTNAATSIEGAEIEEIPAETYTGTRIKPDPVVTLDGVTLEKNKDYTVSYSGNKNPGTAKVIVTGKGNYAGTVEAPFTICYTDVPIKHNYSKAVYWATEQSIAAGYSGKKAGQFGINDNITRGQVVTFLWRAAGRPEPVDTTTQTFNDVPVTHSFYKAIQWASEQRITGGYTGSRKGQFGPNDDCTRGQIMTFLWRYAGKPEPEGTGNEFTDVPAGHSYYKPVMWASEQGITGGYKDGTFGVKKPCTRGHCVVFIYRLMR